MTASVFACAVTVLVADARPASAQVVSASKVTPADMRPAANPPTAISIPTGGSATPPANASSLYVVVGKVAVEGGFAELEAETAEAVAPIEGKRVSLSAIYAITDAIERAYALHGYGLVRVAIPPQKLEHGGKLRLVIVDGFIESVDLKGVPERQRDLISRQTASLVDQRHVRLQEIERRLLLASDIPGLTLSSTLARGATPGGARLILEATQRPVTGSIGLDNDLPASLRDFEFTGSVAINSALGLGDQFYATATASYELGKLTDGQSPIQVFGGGFSVPIGEDGFKVNPEYTNTVTRPAPPAGTPATAGYFQRFDLRGTYPLLLTRAQEIRLQATLGWVEEHLTPVGFATDLYRDRYFVARLQAEDKWQTPMGGRIDATLAVSKGLGGRGADEAASTGIPLSQQGASPSFGKLAFNFNWTQPIASDFQGVLNGQWQSTFGKPVFVSEQIALDGPQAASGYPVGTFTVDEGATLRAEIGRPYSLLGPTFQATLTPYLFSAGGRGWIDQPTAAQQANIDTASFGLGLRTSESWTGALGEALVNVELARALSNVPTQKQGYRGNISVAVKF